MPKMRLLASSAVIGAQIMAVGPAAANDDFVKGLIGGMIGTAIISSQQNQARAAQSAPSRPAISAAEREINKKVQAALNYFGFPVGTVDGVMGQRSRNAISQLQVFMGYPMTGQLNSFEQDFLFTAHQRALLGGQATNVQIARNPMGAKGLLHIYRDEMARAVAPQPLAPQPLAPQPLAPQPVAAAPAQPVAQAQPAQQTAVSISVGASQAEMTEMQETVDRLAEQIALLETVLEHQRANANGSYGSAKIAAIRARISNYEAEQDDISETAQDRFATPIRPTNTNLGMTALRASEIFPRIPYYIPGTEQIGEFWVRPGITDEGYLRYEVNFMDPEAAYGTVVESIAMSSENVSLVISGLEKVNEWTEVAQQNNIRKRFAKRATCFPEPDCAEIKVGNSSTEVVFLTYEDGSTAGQLKRNKGPASSGYNLSHESGMLLAAYLEYMIDLGEKEFNAATMTESDLDAMFK